MSAKKIREKECAICSLIRYYLLNWKHDMKCYECETIWKIPIRPPASTSSPQHATGNLSDIFSSRVFFGAFKTQNHENNKKM